MFGEGLHNFLKSNAAIQALIGTPGTRGDKTPGVFPMVPSIKEPTLSFITYMEIFGNNEQTYEGPNRLMTVRYRIASWGSSYGNAKTLANTVKLQLNGYRGTFSDGSVVLNTMDVTETDTTEDLPEGTMYGTHTDFEFSYQDHSDGH
jgi:hypothetical protein